MLATIYIFVVLATPMRAFGQDLMITNPMDTPTVGTEEPALKRRQGQRIPSSSPRSYNAVTSPTPINSPAIDSNQEQRPNIDGQCGKTASCASGYCCSAAGWCGKGNEYCASPDCQLDYGTGCDGNKKPRGKSTANVPRHRSNPNLLYGDSGIYECTVPKTAALTFDDGPYSYTSHILDLLDSYKAKATFFITGNNNGKGAIDNPKYPWAGIIKRMHRSGHQIASHTWSHQDLSTISKKQLQNQIYWNEMALRNILGFFPQYIRPPYSSCNTECQEFLAFTGYHTIYFNLDSEDYLHSDPSVIQVSKDILGGNITRTARPHWLIIEHDIHQQTAYNLTEYTLKQFQAKGYKLVTVGECLGDDESNWYRRPKDKVPTPSPTPPQVLPLPSTNGQCGSTGGVDLRQCIAGQVVREITEAAENRRLHKYLEDSCLHLRMDLVDQGLDLHAPVQDTAVVARNTHSAALRTTIAAKDAKAGLEVAVCPAQALRVVTVVVTQLQQPHRQVQEQQASPRRRRRRREISVKMGNVEVKQEQRAQDPSTVVAAYSSPPREASVIQEKCVNCTK